MWYQRERKKFRKVRDSEIVRRRGGTWRRKTCGRSEEEKGQRCTSAAQSHSRGSLKASLTSPSAMCLCLSFQTLAQRISEAHAHASANKHNAQSYPCRYRHALILTAKVLKMWVLHSVKWVCNSSVVCTQIYTQTHQRLSHLSWVVLLRR